MTLTPPDLGFNAALFPEYRAHQLDIAMALTEHKRFSLLSAPTGAGKSLIYLTAAKLLGARTLILTGTKGLQEQLMSDFSDAGMVDIRGQSNYRCVALDRSLRDFGKRGGGCDEGPCHAGVYCALRHEGGCHYYDAQDAARHAQIVVTNYAYWMTLGRYSDPHAIGEFDLLVLDEAHTAPDHLSSFCAVSFDSEKVNALLGLRLPAVSEGLPVWVDWARSSLTVAIRRTKEAQDDIKKAQGSARGLAVHRVLSLTDIARGLERLAGAGRWLNADAATRDAHMPGADTDWVAEAFKTKHSSGIRFTPVWAHAYAEPVIFRGIPKIVLVSATLTRDVGKYLGIAPEEMDYREVRSSFDPRRRPLIYVPTVRVDRSMNEGAKRLWMNRIDKVISTRLDRKGIIHTRCIAPHHRVLTANLEWVRADSVTRGQRLAAFDESAPAGSGFARQWRTAEVEDVQVGVRPCVELFLDDGRVITCSADHLWLTNNGLLPRWTRADRLMTGAKASSHLTQVVETWEVDRTWLGGYVAGLYDGEGCFQPRRARGDGRYSAVGVAFSQKPGSVLDRACESLVEMGFMPRYSGATSSSAASLHIGGGLSEVVRFLGSVRPQRLLEKFSFDGTGKLKPLRRVRVVERRSIGMYPVVSIRTTARTMIVEGLASHNSYERAREIVARSKWADYMMTHDTYSLRDVVAAFKDAEPPAILVSPSVEEGFDFPLDECRYQILAKVPFIDGRSPVIKARMQSDKGYGNHIAAMALIQQVGRGVRSSRDFSESFIFDDHFLWFRRQASFPKWFKDSWRILDTVPPAPPLDEG